MIVSVPIEESRKGKKQFCDQGMHERSQAGNLQYPQICSSQRGANAASSTDQLAGATMMVIPMRAAPRSLREIVNRDPSCLSAWRDLQWCYSNLRWCGRRWSRGMHVGQFWSGTWQLNGFGFAVE